ncbi:hypothetical protein [Amycolatopsis sp. NPDC102389]|uniref:hypothetical protein n=1 Tax=Amycolatopsis sp. NPDC102389 TaxID=3363941 RepID=UPI0038185AD6
MEAKAVNSHGWPLRRYVTVAGVVSSHKFYGLLLRLENGDEGHVDSSDVADHPVSPADWPPVGKSVKGVLLGPTRMGRVRLSLRDSDVALVEELRDPEADIEQWAALKEVGAGNVNARDAFFASSGAVPFLRWALVRPSYSSDKKLAEELLIMAPRGIKSRLGLPE